VVESTQGIPPKAWHSRLKRWRNSLIVRNALWLGITSTYAQLAGALLVLLQARIWGPQVFGVFSIGQAFASMAFVFAEMGLPLWIRREVARDRNGSGRYLTTGLILGGTASVAVVVASALILRFLPYDETTRSAVYLSSGIACLELLSALCVAAVQGQEQMQVDGKVLFVTSTLKAGIGAYLVLRGNGLLVCLSWFLILSGIRFAILMRILLHDWRIRLVVPKRAELTRALAQTLPIGFGIAVSIVNYRLSTVMLSAMDTSEAVGLFNSAYMVFMFMALGPPVIFHAALPRFAVAYPAQIAEARRLYLWMQAVMILAGIVCCCAMWLIGAWVLPALFGSAYRAAAPAFLWLGAAVPLLFVQMISSGTLTVIGLGKLNSLLMVVVVAVTVIGNLILVPRLSFVGAAVSTFTSYFVGCLITTAPAARALRDRGRIQQERR
jgi:O-antigen/teichoic acid export membrane protein